MDMTRDDQTRYTPSGVRLRARVRRPGTLEPLLEGLVLLSTAPNADWLPAFVAMSERHPLPAVATATERYEADPTDANLREIAVCSAAWNFTPASVEAGAELLGRMPYNGAAVAWSDEHFDHIYVSTWFPRQLPMLIVSGGEDRIVTQRLAAFAELAEVLGDDGARS